MAGGCSICSSAAGGSSEDTGASSVATTFLRCCGAAGSSSADDHASSSSSTLAAGESTLKRRTSRPRGRCFSDGGDDDPGAAFLRAGRVGGPRFGNDACRDDDAVGCREDHADASVSDERTEASLGPSCGARRASAVGLRCFFFAGATLPALAGLRGAAATFFFGDARAVDAKVGCALDATLGCPSLLVFLSGARTAVGL
mmetsp:Transcript_21813/g.75426  ORF Transcript_21813/g.75426 Transcript_21813/m.75426 type:complete len:200 (-) Transcript_21813:390-989(-)